MSRPFRECIIHIDPKGTPSLEPRKGLIAVGTAAQAIIEEIKRQFDEIPGLREGNAAPVVRSVGRLGIGNILPAYFSNAGLGSNVSRWLGPPHMKTNTTDFARIG